MLSYTRLFLDHNSNNNYCNIVLISETPNYRQAFQTHGISPHNRMVGDRVRNREMIYIRTFAEMGNVIFGVTLRLLKRFRVLQHRFQTPPVIFAT